MTKTQRTILFFLPIQALVVFLFYYLTRYWYFGIVLQVGLTVLMMRRLLTGGNRPVVIAKSAQPALFVVIASLYSMLLVQLYGVSIPYFIIQTAIIVAIYGLISTAVLQTQLRLWLASVIAVLQLFLSINLMTLAMAYWRVPGLLSLPVTFVIAGFVGLWWLLEADKPSESSSLLAAIFALIVTELVWVYSHWVLVYQVPKVNLVATQAAVVICALGYALGGIYVHREDKPMRFRVLVEYGAVFAIVFLITFISTRWLNGY